MISDSSESNICVETETLREESVDSRSQSDSLICNTAGISESVDDITESEINSYSEKDHDKENSCEFQEKALSVL